MYSSQDSSSVPFIGSASTTYSDGTPTVTYSFSQNGGHSRFGTPSQIADAAGTRTLGYRFDDAQPWYEWFDQGYYGSITAGYGRDINYTYASSGIVGRPTGYAVGWGNQSDSILQLSVGYDSVGRPNQITTGGGIGSRDFTYTYNASSNNIHTLTSGSYLRTSDWESWRENVGKVTTTWSSTNKAEFFYNWDWMGRRSNEIVKGQFTGSLSGWSVPYGFADTWTYDRRSQVTASLPYALDSGGNINSSAPQTPAFREWTLDPIGNRITEKRANGSALTWTTNNLNQVTGTPASPGVNLGNPTYDDSGNLKSQAGWTYTFDGENRLRTAYNTSTSETFVYSYDYLSRRIRKERYNSVFTKLEDTKYLYVGWQLIAELDGFNINGTGAGNVKRSYAWGLDALNSVGGAGGTGALLMVRESNAGPRYLPLYDGRQNVRGYLDESGNVVAAFEYSSSGETVASGGSYTTAPIRYASLYQDTETGFYCHHHRYYSPALGRFINRDPIGVNGGLNLYAYVGNNTVNRWDMLGLDWELVCEDLGDWFALTTVINDESHNPEEAWMPIPHIECHLEWVPDHHVYDGDFDGGSSSGGGQPPSPVASDESPCNYSKGRGAEGYRRPDHYQMWPAGGYSRTPGDWVPPTDRGPGLDWVNNESRGGYLFETAASGNLAILGSSYGHAWILSNNGVLAEYRFSGISLSGGIGLGSLAGGSYSAQFGTVSNFGNPSDYAGAFIILSGAMGPAIYSHGYPPTGGASSNALGVNISDTILSAGVALSGYELIRYTETNLKISNEEEWRDFAINCLGSKWN